MVMSTLELRILVVVIENDSSALSFVFWFLCSATLVVAALQIGPVWTKLFGVDSHYEKEHIESWEWQAKN